MYAPVFCADVCKNTGRTLLFVVWTYEGETTRRTLTNSMPYSVNSTMNIHSIVCRSTGILCFCGKCRGIVRDPLDCLWQMQRRCFYVGCRLLCVVQAACGKYKNYLLAYIFLEKFSVMS
jgi:hypothetical protein